MAADGVFRVVVGVDGSPPAVAALEWAVEEARLRAGALHLVTAWHYPVTGDAAGLAPDYGSFEEEARKEQAEALYGVVDSGCRSPAR